MTPAIRLLIADDARRSREGLRALLATARLKPTSKATTQARPTPWPEIEVVGEATNGQQAMRLIQERQPDVVVMDARMPVVDGLQATRLIKDRWPQVKVVVLSMYPSYRTQALAAGADAFLVKGGAPDVLLKAISESTGEER